MVIMDKGCEMRGFLSFLVLRLITMRSMSGEEIRQEIKKRKGTKPSPGTIYPVLKSLTEKGLIEEVDSKGKEKKYQLTKQGKKEVKHATQFFLEMFCDLKDDFKKA